MTKRTPEAAATREILLGTRHLVLWFRNPVGRAIPLHAAHPLVYGVGGVGGADYIGIVRATGRFIAMEDKRADGRGVITDEQANFLRVVREAGGIGVVATCVRDVVQAIEESAGDMKKLPSTHVQPTPESRSATPQCNDPALRQQPGSWSTEREVR